MEIGYTLIRNILEEQLKIESERLTEEYKGKYIAKKSGRRYNYLGKIIKITHLYGINVYGKYIEDKIYVTYENQNGETKQNLLIGGAIDSYLMEDDYDALKLRMELES